METYYNPEDLAKFSADGVGEGAHCVGGGGCRPMPLLHRFLYQHVHGDGRDQRADDRGVPCGKRHSRRRRVGAWRSDGGLGRQTGDVDSHVLY